jgi:endo-1,4-beta-xylanase
MRKRRTIMNIQNWVVCGAAVVAVLIGVAVPAGAKEPSSSPATTLRQAAGDRILIGAAVMSNHLDDPRLAGLIAEQFNCLTPENEMKPDQLQKVKGEFTFDRADKIVAFAQSHDMTVIGHTLCWHQQSPAWMYTDENKQPLPREVALENLRNHIRAVVGRYKGKVKGWDVVNEAIGDSEPYLRDTPARRAIGDDFVVKAFQFAREADPDAELYYNDYNIERPYKRDKALRLIRELKAAGVRLDGVGIQGHWLLDRTDSKDIEDGIKAFAAEGLKVMITEMDVDPLPRKKGGGADLSATEREGLDPFKDGLPDDVQQQLATRFRELFTTFLKYPQVTRVTLWGTHDGSSWLNNWPVRGRTNYPLLWDRDLRPKPAFEAVLQALRSSPR